MKEGHIIEIHHPTGEDYNFYFRIVIPKVGALVSSHFQDYSTCNTALQEFKEKCKVTENWKLFDLLPEPFKPGASDSLVCVLFLKKYNKSRCPDVKSTVKSNFSFEKNKEGVDAFKLIFASVSLVIDNMPLYRLGVD